MALAFFLSVIIWKWEEREGGLGGGGKERKMSKWYVTKKNGAALAHGGRDTGVGGWGETNMCESKRGWGSGEKIKESTQNSSGKGRQAVWSLIRVCCLSTGGKDTYTNQVAPLFLNQGKSVPCSVARGEKHTGAKAEAWKQQKDCQCI